MNYCTGIEQDGLQAPKHLRLTNRSGLHRSLEVGSLVGGENTLSTMDCRRVLDLSILLFL